MTLTDVTLSYPLDCHATDGPPGPSVAKYVAVDGPPGPSVAAIVVPPTICGAVSGPP